MSNMELTKPMRTLVEDISGIGAGDDALVLTDDTRRDLARALAGALRAAGATAAIVVIPYEDRGGVEPPAMAAAAMCEADYVFVMTPNNLTHTDAHREAQAAGTEISSMWGASEDLFLHGPSPENFEEVDRLTRRVKNALEDRSRVEITTDAGTDISFGIQDRPIIALGIKANDKSEVADFPVGEVAVAPVEGTAKGTVVVDVGLDVLGLVATPVEITFEGGMVTSISGGDEAASLRRMLEEADENAGNLAEFAIGTNPDARVVDHIRETKKRLGTIHLAVGDSATIGGTVSSDIHLDSIVRDPTIDVDGEKIMVSGDLRI